jgi:hypothetical protein
MYVGADDYAQLFIDGNLLGTYDAYPSGGFSKVVDLSPGWHSITIDYENRWGSNGLGLSWQFPGDPDSWVVPLTSLRSQNATGDTVAGLRADYYSLSGSSLFTVYGEGSIANGATWFGTDLGETYEGQPGLWGGQLGPWALFEERLSGEISVPSTGAPEPGTFSLLGASLGVGFLSRFLGPFRGRQGRRAAA